jgi:hypothetical protein
MKPAVPAILLLAILGIAGNCQPQRMGTVDNPGSSVSRGQTVHLYNADPDHPWNRLHAALLVRYDVEPPLGADDVDPLLWRKTKFLLAGPSHERALRELREFLRNHAERLIADPVKRAVLQHDLWGVFDWLADPEGPEQPARKELQRPLAEVIRRLALSQDEIARLPDNCAAAVNSSAYASRYDPNHRERAFLPAHLVAPQKEWVILGDEGDQAGQRDLTPVHRRFSRGRSVFVVLMRLPDGRAATEQYLQRVRDFPEPWVTEPLYKDLPESRDPLMMNPKAPQFPAGTQVALVRRMIVIDDHGILRPTPLAQSVQLRVYVTDPATTAFGNSDSQDAYEWVLSRSQLFAGQAGGLVIEGGHRTSPFILSSSSDPFTDPLEESTQSRYDLQAALRPLRTPPEMRSVTCVSCHAGAGISSVNIYSQSFSDRMLKVPRLFPQADARDVESAVLKWKETQYEAGLLRAMMEEPK